MAKITSKANLNLGTEVQLNLVDIQDADISINVLTGSTGEINQVAGDFTVDDLVAGLNKRAPVVGDIITIAHTTEAGNEGVQVQLDSVTALQLTYDAVITGTPVPESAGSDINITATKKTYQFLAAGNLDFVDGVEGLVFNAWMTDQWDVGNYDIYPRPFTTIEPRAKSIASINGWEPEDAATTNAIRDTAMEIRPTATGAATKIYALWRSGDLDDTLDTFKFWPSSDAAITAPVAAVMSGYINQLFLVYDVDGADNTFTGNTVTWFTRCAEEGKTIVMEEHNVSYAEIIPVSAANAIDPKLVATDATDFNAGIYANIDITDDTLAYSGDVNSVSYDFDLLIAGDSQTTQTVHEKVNWLLRQITDINQGDAGVLRGDKQWPITTFSGDVFTVQGYMINYQVAQRNELRYVDIIPVTRSWPSIYTLTINAPPIAVGGTFSVIHKDTYGASSAVYLDNDTPVPQQDITIGASVGIPIAFSTYNKDGHTPGDDIELVLTWNKANSIEPDFNDTIVMGAANQSVSITPTADGSYTTA